MNSRERILAAINHKETDRIPVDLGATPSSGISVVAYQNLIKYLGKNHLRTEVYDVIQEVVQPEMEFLDLFGVDVVDVGRNFNQDSNYWHEIEIIKNYPALYPNWFNPVQQKNGSWLAYNKNGEAVGKMPMGATFFDQTIFPYLDGYPKNYLKAMNDISKSELVDRVSNSFKRFFLGEYILEILPDGLVENLDDKIAIDEKSIKLFLTTCERTRLSVLTGVICDYEGNPTNILDQITREELVIKTDKNRAVSILRQDRLRKLR